MCGFFFGKFQCLPVDDYSAVSCDSGVLASGSDNTSFYSAILVCGVTVFLKLKSESQSLVGGLLKTYCWDPLPGFSRETEPIGCVYVYVCLCVCVCVYVCVCLA